MKTLTQRITTLSTAAVLAFSSLLSFLPSMSTYAEIDPSAAQTTSSTTIVKTESITEKVARDINRSDYINNKKNEWVNSGNGQSKGEAYTASWLALYVADTENDIYKYPVFEHTYFVGVQTSEGCGVILVGDPDEITDAEPPAGECVTTYLYEDRYQEVTVELASLDDYEVIDEINLTVNLPKAGTEITMQDDDIDTQRPQADITLPEGAEFYLWGDEYMNYAYWRQADYEPFTGVLEKDGKYYIELYLKINHGALALFADNPTLIINGVETAYEITEGFEDGSAIGFWFEVTIDGEEEPTSDISAPDSGAFTSSSSATPCISGAAIITTIALGFVLVRSKSPNKEEDQS